MGSLKENNTQSIDLPAWALWLVFLVVPAGLNPIVILLINPIADALWFGQVDPLFGMIENNPGLAVHGLDALSLMRLIPFVVTVPIIAAYIFRMAHVIYRPGHPKRSAYAFNTPFFLSIFIPLGWLVSFVVNVYSLHYHNLHYTTDDFFISLGFTLFVALFLNVLGFYLMDLLNRAFLVPRMALSGEEIQKSRSIFNLSLRSRIFILLGGTAGFGVYFYTYTLYIQSIKLHTLGVDVDFGNFLILGLILLGALVIFGLLFHDGLVFPLKSMEFAAKKIEDQDYSHSIPIRTGDELGLLSKAMNNMTLGLAEKERVQGLFGRYLSPEVVKVLMQEQKAVEAGAIKRLTVLFTDIQGYTSLSEGLSPAGSGPDPQRSTLGQSWASSKSTGAR
jgi:HAMP domain-containing protein